MARGNSGEAAVFAAAAMAVVALVALLIRQILSLRARRIVESQIQLQTVFDSLTEGILVLDRGGNVVQINRAAMRIFDQKQRFSHAQQITDNFEVFRPDGEAVEPERRPAFLALRGVFLRNIEMKLRNIASGSSLLCSINSAPVYDHAGQLAQVIISYRDVTEHREANEARDRLAAIVESSEDAIISKKLDGTIATWNKGAEKIFGYTAEEMIGHSIRRILLPGHEEEEDEILARIARGETVAHGEAMRLRKDGQVIHVLLTVSPIHNAEGKIVGASKIARDITDRKTLERQLRQSQKLEAIGQLTGGVAHDFNNLLGIMMGNLDLLERQLAGNEPARVRVQTALRAAARGADLTRRLLAFSSREELKPAPTSLQDSIENMLDLARHTIGPEIRITTNLDRSLPPVFVDASGLENALLNLVVNARDAMPKGGSLSITTKTLALESHYPPVQTHEINAGPYACISVTDTGSGMPPEVLEHVFEPFFTTKPRGKGTGLGLAMVWGFAKQSGGTVRIYSEPGFGTTVSVYLPLGGVPAEPAHESSEQGDSLSKGGKVLLVDDEPALLEIAASFLEEMGYDVLQAKDAVQALRMVEQHPDIDLLVTDVIMPGAVNGVELVRRVREQSPKTKVIFTSGFPTDALAERSGTNIDGPLLQKPYQRAELAAIVRRVLESVVPLPED